MKIDEFFSTSFHRSGCSSFSGELKNNTKKCSGPLQDSMGHRQHLLQVNGAMKMSLCFALDINRTS